MENFETIFPSFEIAKEIDFTMKSDLPYPNYTFNYFEKELEPFLEKFLQENVTAPAAAPIKGNAPALWSTII